MQMSGGGYSPMPDSSYPSSGYPSSVPPGVASSFSAGAYPSYGGGSMPMPIHGTPYPTSAVSMPGVASSYQGSSMPMVMHRGRSSSMSYAQNPYLGTAVSAGGMIVPQTPGTIVVTKPHRKHKHHHHHHSRSRRSRSSDRY